MAKSKFRVWHIAQVGADVDPFYVEVDHHDQAIKVINMLADYDNYQFENKIKPDYCNTSGLEVFDGAEWVEWECPETGDDINEVIRNQG